MKTALCKELIEKIRCFAKTHTKSSRYEHSVRVAETCVEICKNYGFDENLGYLVGIAHDICKDFTKDEILRLVKMDGEFISDFEMNNISTLLHGRAAAVLLKNEFAIKDADVLEAVATHTSGFGSSVLSKVLFLADKIEPFRPQSTEEYRSNLLKMTFNQMYYSIFKENYEYLIAKGYEPHPNTKKVLEYLKSISED